MARPRANANAVPTEERVLAAAERVFGAVPYERARLADIAAAAGITRPSLLYHFKSKDLLYQAVVGRVFEALRANFAAVMTTPGTFDEKVIELMQSYLDFLEVRPAFAPIVLREILDGQGPMRDALLHQLQPLLDMVEVYLERVGRLPADMPIRAAILQLGSDALVRAAAGDLREPLWGAEPATLALARMLFIDSRIAKHEER